MQAGPWRKMDFLPDARAPVVGVAVCERCLLSGDD